MLIKYKIDENGNHVMYIEKLEIIEGYGRSKEEARKSLNVSIERVRNDLETMLRVDNGNIQLTEVNINPSRLPSGEEVIKRMLDTINQRPTVEEIAKKY